jgi:hypothetical protein
MDPREQALVDALAGAFERLYDMEERLAECEEAFVTLQREQGRRQ